jgi:hypothetical protein
MSKVNCIHIPSIDSRGTIYQPGVQKCPGGVVEDHMHVDQGPREYKLKSPGSSGLRVPRVRVRARVNKAKYKMRQGISNQPVK